LHLILSDKNSFAIGRQALFVPIALTRSNPFINYNISESTVFVQACQYRFPQILILMMVLGDLGHCKSAQCLTLTNYIYFCALYLTIHSSQ
jgi:hypothetical protein